MTTKFGHNFDILPGYTCFYCFSQKKAPLAKAGGEQHFSGLRALTSAISNKSSSSSLADGWLSTFLWFIMALFALGLTTAQSVKSWHVIPSRSGANSKFDHLKISQTPGCPYWARQIILDRNALILAKTPLCVFVCLRVSWCPLSSTPRQGCVFPPQPLFYAKNSIRKNLCYIIYLSRLPLYLFNPGDFSWLEWRLWMNLTQLLKSRSLR